MEKEQRCEELVAKREAFRLCHCIGLTNPSACQDGKYDARFDELSAPSSRASGPESGGHAWPHGISCCAERLYHATQVANARSCAGDHTTAGRQFAGSRIPSGQQRHSVALFRR